MQKYRVSAGHTTIPGGFVVSLTGEQAKQHASRLEKIKGNEYLAIKPIRLSRGKVFGCNLEPARVVKLEEKRQKEVKETE